MANGIKRILVVDDDSELASLVAYVLGAEGFEVEAASDGQEGLQAVARRMPDLILLDMLMPVMDGGQFARKFHARYGSQTPILVLTAAEDPRRLADELGAEGWIGKPFDLRILIESVRRYAAPGQDGPRMESTRSQQ